MYGLLTIGYFMKLLLLPNQKDMPLNGSIQHTVAISNMGLSLRSIRVQPLESEEEEGSTRARSASAGLMALPYII